jgi:hypothetical protein
MSQQESAAVRNANKHFRKEQQIKVVAAVWQEYSDLEHATRLKTARLRAERLARDAAAKVALVPHRNSPAGCTSHSRRSIRNTSV